jgi:hypothetical protein
MGKALAGLLIVVAFLAAVVVGIFWLIGNTDAVALAMAEVRASEQAKERLGEPIEKGLLVMGKIEFSGDSGSAQLSIPVSGPKGKGRLYLVAKKRMGVWKAQELQLAGDSYRVDLLKGEGQGSP